MKPVRGFYISRGYVLYSGESSMILNYKDSQEWAPNFWKPLLNLYLSLSLSIHLSIYLSTYLSIYISLCLSIHSFICLSMYLLTVAHRNHRRKLPEGTDPPSFPRPRPGSSAPAPSWTPGAGGPISPRGGLGKS